MLRCYMVLVRENDDGSKEYRLPTVREAKKMGGKALRQFHADFPEKKEDSEHGGIFKDKAHQCEKRSVGETCQ